jgi:hypothetical protein
MPPKQIPSKVQVIVHTSSCRTSGSWTEIFFVDEDALWEEAKIKNLCNEFSYDFSLPRLADHPDKLFAEWIPEWDEMESNSEITPVASDCTFNKRPLVPVKISRIIFVNYCR